MEINTIITRGVVFLLSIMIIFTFTLLVIDRHKAEYCPVQDRISACYKFVGTGGLLGGVSTVRIDCNSTNVEARGYVCKGYENRGFIGKVNK